MRKSVFLSVLLYIGFTMLAAQSFNWYSQADQRWKSDKLGKSRTTIGRSGCVLSCLTMLVNAEATAPATTPDELNKWLARNNGFAGANMRWEILPGVDGLLSGVEYEGQHNKRNDWEYLSNELTKGNKVLVKVGYGRGHWVLVIRQEGPFDNPASYVVNDPGTSQYHDKTLAYWGGFHAARSYSGNWIDATSLKMESNITVSPVSKNESFLYNLLHLDHPADVYVTVKNNLAVPVTGYFLLAVYDENGKFLKVQDSEFSSVPKGESKDLIYSIENMEDITRNHCELRVVFSKTISNQNTLDSSVVLSPEEGANTLSYQFVDETDDEEMN